MFGREQKQLRTQIIAWRREIHQNPELGLDTVKTEALVAGLSGIWG